jgi:hypothetical protein
MTRQAETRFFFATAAYDSRPCLLLWPDLISHVAAQGWADKGIIRVVFVTSPGKFLATIQGERPSDVAGVLVVCSSADNFVQLF